MNIIELDDQPIESVSWANDECSVKVGRDGVTDIRIQMVAIGEDIDTLTRRFLAVYCDDRRLALVNAALVETITYKKADS